MTINRQKFFFDAVSLLCSSLEVNVTLEKFHVFLKQFMPVEVTGIAIYKPELRCVVNLVEVSEDGVNWLEETLPVDEKTAAFVEEENLNKPLFVNDISKHEYLGPMMDIAPPRHHQRFGGDASFLALPLLIDEKWIGNYAIATRGLNQYTREHADLLEPLQEPAALVLTNSLQYREILRLQELLTDENRFLQKELQNFSGYIVGQNYGLKHVMELVKQTASKDNPVMLSGETGTGKEVIANAIHYSSPRRTGPFIKVNCGAIPENLIDSELFGHEKGAFTGAFEQKRGRFERADKGTIFLDEIGELPMAAQVKLLRVIQTHEIERVGGSRTIPLDIRIITATNRDLTQMAAEGEFREDLLFRINVFPIIIPPLRQRQMDIPELVDFFIERKTKELKLPEIPKLAPDTMRPLIAYHWPGNVRELENVVERALIRYNGGLLTLDDFLSPRRQPKDDSPPVDSGEDLSFDAMARQHILRILKMTNGRISGPKGAANLLGLHHNTLRGKMKKLGI